MEKAEIVPLNRNQSGLKLWVTFLQNRTPRLQSYDAEPEELQSAELIFLNLSDLRAERIPFTSDMFRNATARIVPRFIRMRRTFSTDSPVTQVDDQTFVQAWKSTMPNLDPPKSPLSFMQPRPPTPSTIPAKLTVNFVLPYNSELSKKEVIFICLFIFSQNFLLYTCFSVS